MLFYLTLPDELAKEYQLPCGFTLEVRLLHGDRYPTHDEYVSGIIYVDPTHEINDMIEVILHRLYYVKLCQIYDFKTICHYDDDDVEDYVTTTISSMASSLKLKLHNELIPFIETYKGMN